MSNVTPASHESSSTLLFLQYFLPKSYNIRIDNFHFDDSGHKGESQKEVYIIARDILRKMTKNSGKNLRAIDVGCGSGWKLVNYLSNEFSTAGIETEPALSFLRKTYPEQVSYQTILLLRVYQNPMPDFTDLTLQALYEGKIQTKARKTDSPLCPSSKKHIPSRCPIKLQWVPLNGITDNRINRILGSI